MAYSHEDETESRVEEPDLSGSYTARDYLSWPVDELMELIRGKIFKMIPAPAPAHQRIFSNLYLQMAAGQNQLKGCRIWQAPLDVYLVHPGEDWRDAVNIVEPDLFILCDPSKINERGCVGAPDLVVEILSPSTRKKDMTLKRELYQEYGVREYWMISVSERIVIRNLINDKGEYVTQTPAVEGEVIVPRDFPALKVDLEKLFADLPGGG